MKTVFIVEDEPLVQDFCVEFIRGFTRFEIAGCSGNGQEALESCRKLKPSLVIVDIRLPGIDGLELLASLKQELPDTKILLFTATVNPHTIRMALAAKADGFVEKAGGLQCLKNAMEAIDSGKTYFSPYVSSLISQFHLETEIPENPI